MRETENKFMFPLILVVQWNFELVQGNQYQLGDFQLRVGKVVPMHSENLRGIVMEVIGSLLYSLFG